MLKSKPKPTPTPVAEPRVEYIVVGYTQDGELYGYLTERRTITNARHDAVRFGLEGVAEGTAAALCGTPGYCNKIWVAEPADE